MNPFKALSLEERQQLIRTAIYALFDASVVDSYRFFVEDVYDAYAIVCDESASTYWQVAYSIDDTTQALTVAPMTDWQKVTKEYVPLKARPHTPAKAVGADGGEWVLDVTGIPYDGIDADGEYFDPSTNLHEDKFGLPPVVYYHSWPAKGNPTGAPAYIGKTAHVEKRADGVHYRVILDKANALAQKVWEAAKAGAAYASTGSVAHLVRKARDGHILEWPVAELTLLDSRDGLQSKSRYAVAVPVTKAIYAQAGLDPSALDEAPEPEAETEADKASRAATGNPSSARSSQEKDMDETQVKALVASEVGSAVSAALKADREAQAAEAKAKADREAEIAEAVKAERAKWEGEMAKARRLPDTPGAPYVAQFGNLWKYDDLEAADLAIMTSILGDAKRKGTSQRGVSDDAVKALAVRIAEAKEDDVVARRAQSYMKAIGMPLKANELNQSTLSSYGDEWVVTFNSTQLWERIRLLAGIAAKIPTVIVPQGTESVKIPLQSTPPTFYKVAQASAQDSNPGPITRTVKTSKQGTASQTLTVAKMGASTYYSGELEEDSMIPWLGELRSSIENEGAEVLESLVIDGDTATGATTNINCIGGTPAGTENYLLFDGFRKLALVTNTANSRDGGTLTASDFLETVKLLGLAGKNAMDKGMVSFIMDMWTMWKALELPEVKTRDVNAMPTIENGNLTGLYGYQVIPTANMHRANQDATYGLKANTAGKVDLTTPANNTTGSLLAVRWDQWRLGIKRQMSFETVRVPSADATEVVALMRVGLINRDNEASAISYNLGV